LTVPSETPSVFWLGLSVIALVPAYIAWGILHHACWEALPARYRSVAPGTAVAYIFIPLFNCYWAFVTFVGLAKGFNRVRRDRPELPLIDVRGLGVAKAISLISFWTIAWLPGLASLVAVVDLVVFVLYYRSISSNANAVVAGASA
jgi:hypothetical protein